MNANPIENIAIEEMGAMFDAIRRDAPQYFELGQVRAKKALANGAKVTVSIMMPTEKSKRRAVRKAGS